MLRPHGPFLVLQGVSSEQLAAPVHHWLLFQDRSLAGARDHGQLELLERCCHRVY
jgi:hypothetical protein